MPWSFDADPRAFLAAVGHLLDADPVTHTVAVGQVALRPEQSLFGTWSGPGGAGGVIAAPPYPLLTVAVPDVAVRPLVQAWPDGIDAVEGTPALAAQLAAVWCHEHRGSARLRHAERLHRLAGLVEPPPAPGSARLATEDDIDVVSVHVAGFAAEAGVPTPRGDWLRTRLLRGGAGVIWELDGALVSFAGATAPARGQVRIGPVWTPPGHRGRGFGAAVTAAATRWALERAREVLLYTDLANPTSNSLYRRLGYVGVGDVLQLDLIGPGGG